MNDTRNPAPAPADEPQGAGERRPDQQGTAKPGMKDEGPASGGEGAAGAGGPDGFGTGT
jgi:hypothetical protein